MLIVDDFLAVGKAMSGLLDVCQQAGAQVGGIGIAIEKGFQSGGAAPAGRKAIGCPAWPLWTL